MATNLNAKIDNEPLVSPLYSTDDVMEVLRISRGKLYDMIDAGELTRIKFGNKAMFLKTDIDIFIAARVAEARNNIKSVAKPVAEPASDIGWGDWKRNA